MMSEFNFNSGIDVTFIMTIYNKGWILDKISTHMSNEFEKKNLLTTKYFLYGGNKLHHTFPKSKVAFFMHYSNFFRLIKSIESRVGLFPVIWFTHFDKKYNISLKELAQTCVQYNAKIICPCTTNEDALIAAGMPAENVTTVLGGFDPALLKLNYNKSEKDIAFVSACYDRKRPDLLMEVARSCPEYNFHIVGPIRSEIDNKEILWSSSKYINIIKNSNNIQLHEVPYSEYADIIAKCSKYLMLSDFEGGPIGLIEAMAMDVLPIATDTGFVKDLLVGDLNRGILPISPKVEHIVSKIKQDYPMMIIRDTVADYSWIGFAKAVYKFIFQPEVWTSYVSCKAYTDHLYISHYRDIVKLLDLECELRKSARHREAIDLCNKILTSEHTTPAIDKVTSFWLRFHKNSV